MINLNLNDFDKTISSVEKELDKVTVETLQKVVLAVDSAIVLSTPVDTGRARANWLPSIGSPREEALQESYDQTGFTIIAEAESVVSNVIAGDTVYISNNLEYIQKLNDGHSKQAPAGFVEKAIDVVKGI